MKIIQFTFALLVCAIITSCSKTDENLEVIENTKGNLVLKFDNAVGSQDFNFGTAYTKKDGETYKLNVLQYIISNVRLKDADGNVFMYPADKNAFIVDEADANNAGEILLTLTDVDAANYTEITFGVGIDQARYKLGAEGQGEFWDEAEQKGLTWHWAVGYRFTRLEGTFTTSTQTDEQLMIHMGSIGQTLDNYREVTLSLQNTVLVREGKNPSIHIVSDISKVFDGKTSVSFDDGYNRVMTSQETTPVIADNFITSFSINHIHND